MLTNRSRQNDVSITTHRGNEVKKTGTEDDPAVKVSMGGKPAVKQAHELDVEKEGPQHDQAGTATSTSNTGEVKPNQEKAGEEKKAEKSGLQVPNQGRGKSKSKSPAPKAKSAEPEKKEEKKEEAKPAEDKTDDKAKAKRGRKPGAAAGTGAAKKEKPKKRAATESGEPRRSKRTKT